jgi:SAM-dependent methyltransferase
MHSSAMGAAREFFERHGNDFESGTIVEIGSQDVNGSIREVASPRYNYVGLDFQPGKGVDIVLQDAYHFPLESESVEIIVTSSCFEHAEFFWLTFLEGIRVLKPGGLFYINAPSKGEYHAYPQDCWRFYPDAAKALNNWAKHNGYTTEVVYTKTLSETHWGDFIVVIRKT